MKFTFRDIIILFGALITLWGAHKGFNIWLIKNHSTLDVERLQFGLGLILSIACFASIGFSYVLWKKQGVFKAEIGIIKADIETVKREVKSEFKFLARTVDNIQKTQIATLQIHASRGGDEDRAVIARNALKEIGIC